MKQNTRKVNDTSIKMFGSSWKHPALKPYNGKEVSVEPKLNDSHQTELTVRDGQEIICIIKPEARL